MGGTITFLGLFDMLAELRCLLCSEIDVNLKLHFLGGDFAFNWNFRRPRIVGNQRTVNSYEELAKGG